MRAWAALVVLPCLIGFMLTGLGSCFPQDSSAVQSLGADVALRLRGAEPAAESDAGHDGALLGEDMAVDEALAKKWKRCATEGGTCKFAGKKQVRFGAKGKYAYKVYKGSISCTVGKFGDPNKGARKACYINMAAVPDARPAKKSRQKKASGSKKKRRSRKVLQGRTVSSHKKTQSWVECGKENTYCRFKGKRQVRFGAHKMYSYKMATNGVDCTTKKLGDPLEGFSKRCWYLGKPKKEVKYTEWLRCASEGGMCRFKGKRQVRYGSPEMKHAKKALAYAYKQLEDGTACDGHTLDPAHSVKGRHKACWFLASPADMKTYAKFSKKPKPNNKHWVPCGLEGGNCVFQGKKQLRYGAARKFAYTTKVGGAPCSHKTFGHLDTGDFFKRCYYLATRGKGYKKGLMKKGLHWRWKKCADEGGRCKVFANAPDTTGFRSEGETMVRFGGKGVFSYMDVKGSTACTQKSFGGNPLPQSMRKSKLACYFKQQVGPKVDENGCRPDQYVINRVPDKDHPYGHDCITKKTKKKPVKKKVKKVLQKKKSVKKPGKRGQVHPHVN